MYKINQENINHSVAIGQKGKLSMFQAMVQCKCPKCTEGEMFTHGALNLIHFNEVTDQCQICGFRFEVEPGFYQGAMFFIYAFDIAFSIMFGFSAYFVFNDPPLWVYYIAIIAPVIFSVPWIVRYSKVLMLYLFGGVWQSDKNNSFFK